MAKTKAQRRTEAEVRRAEYEALTVEQKLRKAANARGSSRKVVEKLRTLK